MDAWKLLTGNLGGGVRSQGMCMTRPSSPKVYNLSHKVLQGQFDSIN